jgi:hypothetical protein
MPNKIFSPSEELIKRIRNSYCLAINNEEHLGNSVLWAKIIPEKQENIHQALLNSEEDCLSLFGDMLSHDLYYGVDNQCLSIWGSLAPSQRIHFHPQDLVNLATSIGVLDIWNPAGGSKNPHGAKLVPPDESIILELLDAHFSFPITFPDPFGAGMSSNSERGTINNRGLQALYQAYRMRQVATAFGGSRFLEIGGGMGKTAFYAHKFGLADFTVVDIPLGMVRQAFFLAAVLGEDAIWLYGEPEPKIDGIIKIIPPSYFFVLGGRFDVALNADSFTEMSFEDADKYMRLLRNTTRTLISINHEANDFRVRNLWPDMWRFPYPLRAGYIEELGFAKSFQ